MAEIINRKGLALELALALQLDTAQRTHDERKLTAAVLDGIAETFERCPLVLTGHEVAEMLRAVSQKFEPTVVPPGGSDA